MALNYITALSYMDFLIWHLDFLPPCLCRALTSQLAKVLLQVWYRNLIFAWKHIMPHDFPWAQVRWTQLCFQKSMADLRSQIPEFEPYIIAVSALRCSLKEVLLLKPINISPVLETLSSRS